MGILLSELLLEELVEKSYNEEGIAADTLKDLKKKDAKALFFIQQAVDDAGFSSRISAATKATEAWDALRNGYEGTTKAKLKFTKETNVGHERSGSNYNREGPSYRGRRGGRGYRGGGRSSDRKQQSNDDGQNDRKFECYYCHKPGYIERFSRKKQYDEKQANFAKDGDETEKLFANVFDSKVWYTDSSNSSHMTANSEFFISLDKSVKTHIKMVDGTICNTKGKGVIKLNSGGGGCIKDVLYVPDLDSNLSSVGQFLRQAPNRDASYANFSKISLMKLFIMPKSCTKVGALLHPLLLLVVDGRTSFFRELFAGLGLPFCRGFLCR
ncbi:hypothetical protein Salat_2719800 [Sesamum alatum]|uniref:Retrovirus-related Pol polyprotein from transposon TNT 1-94-like beta-barrel domain-containing protein n=1 Tax=Sesamum alatum TaxID=300844 RepID=A0AAE1XQC8_9LAMI|nr:hypothetical protein Salat_2719800 [Sesamum alatum]